MRSNYNLYAEGYNQLAMDLLLRLKGLKPLPPAQRLQKAGCKIVPSAAIPFYQVVCEQS